MFRLIRWIMVSLVILLPRDVHGQCFDCNVGGARTCRAKPGYFCSLGNDIARTSVYMNNSGHYSNCVPDEFFVKDLSSWCCFWSEQKGCQAAVHPRYYDEASRRNLCVQCQSICRCTAAWHEANPVRIMLLIGLLFIVWNRRQ